MARFLPLLVVVLLAGCGMRPIEVVRDKAEFRFDRGQYALAADEYGEIVARQPGDWEAHYYLGLCHLELDQPAEAVDHLQLARTHRPLDPQIVEALAEALYRSGQEHALFSLLTEQAEAVRSVLAYRRLARYSMLMDDPDSAMSAIETAIRIDDGRSVEPYLDAAEYAEHLGDRDEALRRLGQAYGIDPNDDRVLQALEDLGEVPGPTLARPPGP